MPQAAWNFSFFGSHGGYISQSFFAVESGHFLLFLFSCQRNIHRSDVLHFGSRWLGSSMLSPPSLCPSVPRVVPEYLGNGGVVTGKWPGFLKPPGRKTSCQS